MKPNVTAYSAFLALAVSGVLYANPTPQPTPVPNTASTPETSPILSPAAIPTPFASDAHNQALGYLASASHAAAAVPNNASGGLLSEIGTTRAQAGDVAGALKAWKGGIGLDDILKVQAAAGDASGAVANARRLAENDQAREDVLLEIIAGLIEAHRLTEAKTIASTFTDAEPKDQALYKVAAAQADAGDFMAASATADAVSAKAQRGRASYQTAARDHLIDAEVKAGRLDAAKAIADSAKPDDQRAIQSRHLAVAQARQGDIAGANATRDTITLPKEKAKAAFDIAQIQALKGNPEAIAYVTIRHEEVRDIDQQNALTDVARALAQMDQVEAAIKVAGTIDDSQAQANAMCDVAKEQAKAGHTQAAQTTLSSIHQDDPSTRGFVGMAQADIAEEKARAGDIKGAKAIAKRLVKAWKVLALVDILEVQTKAGDVKGAKATLDGLVDDILVKATGTKVIVAAQIRHEGYQVAEAWVKTLRDPYFRAAGYIALAQACLNVSDEGLEHILEDGHTEADDQ